MPRHLLTVYAPLASWGIWLAAVHHWVMGHSPEIQAWSFVAAFLLSVCGLIGWAWKAIRKIHDLFSGS